VTRCGAQDFKRPLRISQLLQHLGGVERKRAAPEVIIEGCCEGDQRLRAEQGISPCVRCTKHLPRQARVGIERVVDAAQESVDVGLRGVRVRLEELENQPVSREPVC